MSIFLSDMYLEPLLSRSLIRSSITERHASSADLPSLISVFIFFIIDSSSIRFICASIIPENAFPAFCNVVSLISSNSSLAEINAFFIFFHSSAGEPKSFI